MTQPTGEPPTLEELSADLVLHTGRLVRAVTRHSSTDVPTASLRLLSQVDELGPVGVGALARADRCSQPTMSAGVQVLCDRGWAVKRPNPADARSSLVSLTGAGRTVLAEARRERAGIVAARFRADPRLTETDLATAVAVLRGLLQNTDTDTEEGTA